MRNVKERFILFFFVIFSLLLISRLFFLQVLKGNYYRALSFGLHNSFSEEIQKRGEIFFRNGEPLALNREYAFVFALTQKVSDKEKTAQILSEILNLDKNFVLEKLNGNSFSIIKRKLSDEEVARVKRANLSGIFIENEIVRYYPQGNLASNLIGFVDKDGRGQYGLEGYFDEILRKGQNLILTLDYKIQLEAEKLLKKAKENLEIEGGQIIVMEPDSGKILAMASFPNFDPNFYQDFTKNLEIFKNPATQNLFEPGSVFKSITMAIALEEEKITPQTTYTDPGEIRINGWVIRNYANRVYPGKITMTEVLEKSINTGAVFAQRQVERPVFYDYLKKFGFFEKTGIDLPEVFSENKELRQMREVNFATVSFGQGIAITPIQLARAYCAIANGGRWVTPYLVENLHQENSEERKVISQKTASQLTSMLVSVVENGYGKRAKIPGYFIAGKTGTSLQPKIGQGGYSEKTWQTFVGFFPAFNPKILILVKLDNPKTKTAEYSAAPIFHDLADYIIRLYQIPPDYE